MAERNHAKGPPSEAPLAADDVIETVLAEPVADVAAPVADITPDPVAPSPHLTTRPSSSGFFPALGGGVLAAMLGFGLSHFNVLNLRSPAPDTSALTDRITAAEAAIGASENALAALRERAPAPLVPDPEVQSRLAALETGAAALAQTPDFEKLTARMDSMEVRLAEIASMPTDGNGAAAAALSALQAEVRALKAAGPAASRDLTAMVEATRAQLDAAQIKAETLTAEAARIAQASRQSTAIVQLRAALDSGGAYAGALAALGDAAIPPVIADHAATGLPTLASLQASFPDAARLALEAALRANMGESWASRIGTFLRSQTGARSLTPREGNDPDAILSRAEASLAMGNIDAALTEIATLPPEAASAMADWTSLADRRRLAAAAISDLAAILEQ